MDRSILNINTFRIKKQTQGEHNANSLLHRGTKFTERNANIREKVRARDLFRKLVGLSNEQVFTPIHEQAFSEWFLFDYQTIQGLTMFSLFLRKHHDQLIEPELIQGALFLTSVFEPIKVEEIHYDKSELVINELFSKKECVMYYENGDVTNISKGSLYFVRKIPIIQRELAIGTMYPVSDNEVLGQLRREYDMTVKVDQIQSWMTYLKRNGVKYLFQT